MNAKDRIARSIAAAASALSELISSEPRESYERIRSLGLFDPEIYLSLNPDVRGHEIDPWQHFLSFGLPEGRQFTNTEIVARLLFKLNSELSAARVRYVDHAAAALADDGSSGPAARLADAGTKAGVFFNTSGNFYMRALADLLQLGLRSAGLEAALRDENSDKAEAFDLRIFVAPHEFFFLGEGPSWVPIAAARNTVLYNVEQVQTPWFCRAFPLLLTAPLVLDLNFQSAEILRKSGIEVVHFAPGYLPATPYSAPIADVSSIDLIKGYAFSRQLYDWSASDTATSRPIDLLFFGTRAARRDAALARLQDLVDRFRFLCIYSANDVPLTPGNYAHASTEIACALGQRAKIVLNIHRDWLGYFEWSRIVLQGIWQGACVVSDPGLPDPIFHAGVHYLEESDRHVGELIRWLLASEDGLATLERTRRAGYERAQNIGCMRVTLAPVLTAFERLLARCPGPSAIDSPPIDLRAAQ